MRHSEYRLCNGHTATGPWIECRDGAKWGTHIHSSGRLNDRERAVIERMHRDVAILNNNSIYAKMRQHRRNTDHSCISGKSPSREHPKENKQTKVANIFSFDLFSVPIEIVAKFDLRTHTFTLQFVSAAVMCDVRWRYTRSWQNVMFKFIIRAFCFQFLCNWT